MVTSPGRYTAAVRIASAIPPHHPAQNARTFRPDDSRPPLLSMSSSTENTTDYTGIAPSCSTRLPWIILAVGLVLALALLPLDHGISQFCRKFQPGGDLRLGGDVRRTLEFLQQFGDVASSILTGIIILLLDPAKKRRIADWIAGALATALFIQALKMLIGRPRPGIIFDSPKPGYDSALQFIGPAGTYPLPRDMDPDLPGRQLGYVERHAWEAWNGISSDLWSMPSSHTSAAAALAVVLATFYPRLAPLVITLACVVGISRVVLGAHFPSDVLVGGAVGACIMLLAMHHRWGSRLLNRISPEPPRTESGR